MLFGVSWEGLLESLLVGLDGLLRALTFLAAALATYFALRNKQDTREVKDAIVGTEAKVEEVAKIAGSTLNKVNSQHGIALETIVHLARKEADRTKKTTDIMSAEHAEKTLQDHVEMERLAAEKQKEAAVPSQAEPKEESPDSGPKEGSIKQIVQDTNVRVRDLENEVEKK